MAKTPMPWQAIEVFSSTSKWNFEMTDAILSPQEAKWAAEAQAVGLTWLKKTKNGYSLFQFDSCGHEQEIQSSGVRANKFRCWKCQEAKWAAEVEDVGLIRLKRTGQCRSLFRFVACGHEQEIGDTNRRSNQFSCKKCVEDKWVANAHSAGLTFIKTTSVGYGLYSFNACGHEQKISRGQVFNGTFRCKVCYETSLKTKAKAKGLTWLKQTKKAYGIFRFNECGHEQEIRSDQVFSGCFTCHLCKKSWIAKESNLYVHVIELSNLTFIKVGIAGDVKFRATQYGLPKNAQVVTVLVIPFETGRLALNFETKVLRAFKHAKHPDVKNIFKNSGKSECFRPEFLSAILEYCKSLH